MLGPYYPHHTPEIEDHFIGVATNSTHVTHEVLAGVVSEHSSPLWVAPHCG